MHITDLRLSGFKSFVETTKAPVEPGLTGVVGPNGCGKSNLLEAVRWVMGATSPKSMRADDMDDVIFAGSAGRPMREHAEVMLVLADAAGKAPGALANDDVLEVARRIRRGLGSTYRINGKEVRAKDVQLLFADAATGANSPALVRQGQISELIASKPENRRRIIEEAAGIAGLHARRHEADLKLRAAEANLARLDEILTEIEGQANNLRKQARQAERYRGLAQTLRETEALLLHRRWSEARAQLADAETAQRAAEREAAVRAEAASAAERALGEAREALGPLREEEMVAAAVLRRLEGVRVGLERDLAEAEAALARAEADARRASEDDARLEALAADAGAALARLSEEIEALGAADDAAGETALQQARDAAQLAAAERADAEAKLEALASDAAASRARAAALAAAANYARARHARALQRQQALAAQIAALAPHDALAARIKAAQAAAQKAQTESNAARAALSEAEAALKQAEKADEAAWAPYRASEAGLREIEAEVKALDKLAPPEGARFPPVMAAIEVKPGFERALAAALGDDLDASTNAEAPARWRGAMAPASMLPNSAKPLAAQVQAPPALTARLALVGVIDAAEGAALQQTLQPGVRLVSREGDLWRWDGFIRTAAAPQPAAARLEHKSRLAAARAELEQAAARHAKAKQMWEEAKAARAKAETAARELRQQAPKLGGKAADVARDLERLELDAQRQNERRTDLETQAETLAAETAEIAAALAQAESAAQQSPASDETALAEARALVAALRSRAAEAAAYSHGIERDRANRAARRVSLDVEATRWRARAAEAAARRQTLAAEAKTIDAARKAALAAPAAARTALAKLMDEAAGAEARRALAGDKVAEAETTARLADTEARAAEQAHAGAREARAGAQAHAAAAQARLEDVLAQAREHTGREPEDLAGIAGPLLTGPLAAASLHEIEKRLERLRGEREAAGPVNLRAEEELAEAQARIESLTAEKHDVAAGIAKLRGAVTKLNNEGRARLLAAFEIVEANFAKLFDALFEGGQATLKLTENEDPLAAGLEIYAQPPGKKLSTLSLMSGGEQALTATALIFAVFLANPAPLCVLDEVDAPLDDANIERFCRMLDEMKRLTATRFMVITHNPVTMSRMDRLYGVTMPEPGVSQLVSVDLGAAKALAATA